MWISRNALNKFTEPDLPAHRTASKQDVWRFGASPQTNPPSNKILYRLLFRQLRFLIKQQNCFPPLFRSKRIQFQNFPVKHLLQYDPVIPVGLSVTSTTSFSSKALPCNGIKHISYSIFCPSKKHIMPLIQKKPYNNCTTTMQRIIDITGITR